MAESHEYRYRFFVGNFTFLGILVAILLVVYFLSGHLNKWKLDLTQDRVYTVSPATKNILGNLKDKITVTYYSSAELPAGLQNLRRDTKDLFDEFYDLSGGKFQYSIVNPDDRAAEHAEERVEEYLRQREEHEKGIRKDPPKEPAPPQSIEDIFGGRRQKTDEELREERQKTANAIAQQTDRKKEDVERDLLRDAYKRNFFRELELRGISAFPVTERQASSVRQVRVFSSIEIRYLSKEPEVIPIHYSIENLEYELASRILKLTQTEKPVVAFFDGRKPPMPKFDPMNPVQPPPSDYEGIINHLGELYDIRSIDLKENDAIDDLVKRLKEDARRKASKGEEPKESDEDKVVKPEDYRLLKVFVVAQPDQLEPRQVYEINRAVSLGIPTIFLVSPYSLDASEGGIQQGLPLRLLYPGLDDLFRKWGVELRKDLLASNSAGSILLPRSAGPRGGLRILVEAPLPVNVASEGPGAIDQQSPLTNRIQQIVFPATTGLRLLTDTLAANKLQHTVLARSTRETWSVEIDPFRQSPFQRGRLMGPTVAQYQEELAKMKPQDFRDFLEPVPLAVHLTGKLPFTFQGETIPEWRKEKKEEKDEDKDSSLFLDAEDPAAPEGGETPAEAVPSPEAAAEAKPEAKPEGTGPAEAKPQGGAEGSAAPQAKPEAEPQAPPEAKAAAAPQAEAKPEEGAKKEEPKPAEAPKASLEVAEGNVVILASVDMLKNTFLMQRSGDYFGNVTLLQNALDTFGLGSDLINIRIKQITVRQFKEGSERKAFWIIAFAMGFVPFCVAALGLIYYFARRYESLQYERRFFER